MHVLGNQYVAKFKLAADGRALGVIYDGPETRLTLSEDIDDAAQKWIVASDPNVKGQFIYNDRFPLISFFVDFEELDPTKRFGPVIAGVSTYTWDFEYGLDTHIRISAVYNWKEVSQWSLVAASGDSAQVGYKNEKYDWSMIRIRDLKPEEYVKVPTGEQVNLLKD